MQVKTFQSKNNAAELMIRIYFNKTIEIAYIDDKEQNPQSQIAADTLLKKVLNFNCKKCNECQEKTGCEYKYFYAKNIFEKHWFYFEQNKFIKTIESTTSYPDENDKKIIVKIANFKRKSD